MPNKLSKMVCMIGTISIYVVNGSVNEYDLKSGKYIHCMYVLANF